MNPAQIAGQFFPGWDEPAPTVGHPVVFSQRLCDPLPPNCNRQKGPWAHIPVSPRSLNLFSPQGVT